MFKDTPEGQTHSYNDGCGIPEHNINIHICTENPCPLRDKECFDVLNNGMEIHYTESSK